MRILHIDTGLMMRGGQTQLMMLARGLRARGHEQTMACPAASALAGAAGAEGFAVLPIERGYWKACRAIRHFLETHPRDIASAHDARAQTVSYLATVGTGMVRVANRLVAFEPRNRFTHWLKYTRTCDLVIASSQAVKDTMTRNGVPPSQVEVIRGGIEFPEQLPERAEARAEMRAKWKLKPDDFVIGHLAAFTAEKGQLEALEALAILLPKHSNVKMILAGDGPLREQAMRKAGRAAVLPGFIQADAEFYAGLDLLLANSSSEALGLAPLYAMAHEVPVIASNVGGLPEVVGESGVLIPPSDVVALARAIEEAMANPMDGRRAREQARGFSAAVTIERTEGLYRRLVDSRCFG